MSEKVATVQFFTGQKVAIKPQHSDVSGEAESLPLVRKELRAPYSIAAKRSCVFDTIAQSSTEPPFDKRGGSPLWSGAVYKSGYRLL